jgi:tripartite-type tricarboxylate transporter receptor subunit TctC
MSSMRRALIGAALAVVLAAAARPGVAPAADCGMLRGQTITFVVPYSPGGGNDLLSRMLEPSLERHAGAEVVIANVPGAGGIVGAKAIRDARADGRTIGIVGGTTLLLARLLGNPEVPSAADDYHVLGQLDYDGRLMAVAADSPIRRVDDLWAPRPARKWVAGLAGAEGAEAVVALGTAALLGLDLATVSGFRGSKEAGLALLRGEVDMVFRSVESALPAIQAGEMRPVLLFAEEPDATTPALRGVPPFGGPEGVAARHAAASGASVPDAIEKARTFGEIGSQRRLVVAPRGLDAGLAECLDQLYMAAATDPGFVADVAAAGRTLDVLPGAEARAIIEAAAQSAAAALPLIEESRRLLQE